MTEKKPAPKRKATEGQTLSDDERHKKFLEMAKEVEASDKKEDFDRAFEKITTNRETLKTRP